MNTESKSNESTSWGMVGVMAAGLAMGSADAAEAPADEQKQADEKLESAAQSGAPEPGEFNNWITFGVGHNFLDGDPAQFQYQRHQPAGTFGGIEDFHYEQSLTKRGLMAIDGRAMFENNDYLIKLTLTEPDKGYLRGGYQEFRTWYDGSGGYSRGSNAWVSIYNEELHVDRSQAWVEAGLTMPDWPTIALRYAYDFRDGKKDSTSWGDYNLRSGFGGAPSLRGIVPSFWDLDEKRHTVAADVRHTIGKTDLGVGVRYEASDNDNARNERRRPGEPTADRYVTQREGVRTDMLNAHGSSETRLSDRLMFSLGYSYTTLDTDISGSRIYGTSYYAPYDPTFPTRQARDEGFLDLTGGSQLQQHVANLNLMWTPWEAFALIPSVRLEVQDQEGVADFTETNFDTSAGNPAVTDDIVNRKTREFLDVSESIEARYTGIKKWAFYARAELLEGTGDLSEREREAPSGPVELFRQTDSDRFTQKYTTGANWYPHRKVNLAGQYYFRLRENNYDHVEDSTRFVGPGAGTDYYPAFIKEQDFQTHDMNVRLTLRPVNGITTVSRYDFQLSTVDTRGDQSPTGAALSSVRSADITTHILSQSVSWTPFARLFLQGALTYVLDQTETPADSIQTGPAANVVQRMRNDYWTVSALVGYALSDKTDVQTGYSYYRANNYHDNSAFSQPYGAGMSQNVATLTFIHRFSRRLLGKITYGIYQNYDELSGSHNDYTAQMIYSTLQYQF